MDRVALIDLLAGALEADPGLREALIADPRAAIGQLTGLDVPEGLRITVHEESPADIHLVIGGPALLRDEDLELVSGAGSGAQSVLCQGCYSCL